MTPDLLNRFVLTVEPECFECNRLAQFVAAA